MFDSVIFAFWPRGLYLAKKLSEKGQKVAYVEILPRTKSPFGIFLDDNFKEEKEFLENLGFLSRQEGGFCLLSPEGVWPLQDMREMTDRHFVLKNKLNENSFKEFDKYWLSYLSLNLAGKVFEYNNSEFSNKNVNLFSDYFLFKPYFKKIEYFQKTHPNITFYQAQLEEISFEKKEIAFCVQQQPIESQMYFWLAGNHFPILKKKKNFEPHWQWSAYFFKSDFGDYEEVIPPHFVSIKNLFLPWTHDNLLSVFHKEEQLEIWIREAYKGDKNLLDQGVKEHLENYFPGCAFSPIEKKSPTGLTVYSKESLKFKASDLKDRIYIENLNDFFQGDLVSEIRAERELFENLSQMKKQD